ncbi:Telomerase reverse transcriptase [Coemansia sp. IMI 209128]|nr:Telomerase reverse transcriptase [Coemansia sp. IMI 209128]
MDSGALAPFFPAVTPLGEYMDALVGGGRCLQDNDTADFRRFLRSVLVGHTPIKTRLVLSEPVERLADTVRAVIGMLLKRESSSSDSQVAWRGRNILAMGYEARRDGTMSCAGGGWGVVNTCVNSSVVELGKRRWSLLLDRTGTEAMVHLFLHASVFLPLHNGSFNQISGVPLVNLPMPQPTPIVVPAINALCGPATTRGTKRRRTAEECQASTEIDNGDTGHGEGSQGQTLSNKGEQRAAKRQRRCDSSDSGSQVAPGEERSRQSAPDLAPELANVVVDTSTMLYSHPRLARHKVKWSLPQIFPLGVDIPPGELVKKMFVRAPAFATNPPSRLVSLAARMAKLHKKFNYRFHLFKRCPAPWQSPSTSPDSANSRPDSAVDDNPPSFLEMASSPHDVYLFLQTCVRSVVPRDLIGGKHNHRLLHKLLRSLANSSRFGHIDVSVAASKAKVDEVTGWLGGKRGSAADDIYAGFLYWVLKDYAIQLIRAFFYVTESSSDRSRLFFFRGDVWTKITRQALRSLESEIYTKKTLADASASGSTRSSLGYSRLRLLPKEHGFRAISNLKKSFVVKQKTLWRSGNRKPIRDYVELPVTSTNKQLASSLAALTYLRKAHPQLVGSTVTNISDIYAKLRAFKSGEHVKPLLGNASFYMGKLDIQRAYDTIVQSKLLDLLETQLPSEEYMVYRYWTLLPSFGRYRSSFLRLGGMSSESIPFGDMARSLSKKSRQVIFGDQSATDYLDTDSIRQLIREHVTNNMVRMRSGIWQQKKGIPQGSVLSAMLCNFFYGQLEREHLSGFVNPAHTLMMRMVDDFIVISSDPSQVVAVLEFMHRGVAEYGCELNRAKTLVNFEATICGERIGQAGSAKFPWCGLVFDERTLDVSADYGRLAQAGMMSVAIGAKSAQTTGCVLGHKVSLAVRLKMHKLYMDCSLNSRETVLINLYQNFLVSAKKMHAVCHRLPAANKGDDALVKVVWDAISLGYMLLRTRCGDNTVPPADVTWLGLTAFHTAFQRKQSRYTQLLARLHSALSLPKFSRMARRHAAIVNSPDNKVALSIVY